MELKDFLTYEDVNVQILDSHVHRLRKKELVLVNVVRNGNMETEMLRKQKNP